jgi:hypothetical protein
MTLAAQSYAAAQGHQAPKRPTTFPAPKVVWEKSLPDSSRLTVTRAEVPYVPPTEEEKRELLRGFPPGTRLGGPPRHVYRYSFTRAKAGDPPKELWACHDVDRGDGLLNGVTTVLDAAVEDDHLIVVFQQSPGYYAQVIDSKKAPLITGEWADQLTQGRLRPEMVTGGSISGSLAKGTLAVHLRRLGPIPGVDVAPLTFRLRKVNNAYNWVLDQPASKPARAPRMPRAENQR